MTLLDAALAGAGGALLVLGAVFCALGETGPGGPMFAFGLALTMHVALRWRRQP